MRAIDDGVKGVMKAESYITSRDLRKTRSFAPIPNSLLRRTISRKPLNKIVKQMIGHYDSSVIILVFFYLSFINQRKESYITLP